MNDITSTTLIIIPTYNEVENIGNLLIQLLAEVPGAHLLVVDDNSPDGTNKRVRQIQQHDANVYLLSRPKKLGLAQAYQAGFAWGMERNYRYFVQMDADFSHRPSDVSTILEGLETNDVVMGCRYIDGGGISGWSFIRQGISRGGNWYARALLRLPYQDLTGGFTGWRREVIEKIGIEALKSRGYAYQVELKLRAHRMGVRIKEVPIFFENRKLGRSKMSSNIVFEAALRVFQLRRWLPS